MATNKPSFFFLETQNISDQLGNMFSFIWANYLGLRELWWQVRGFKNQFPELPIKDIEKKFIAGLPIPGGIDFKYIALNTNWEKHEAEFSKLLLFETCTLYECWLEKICFDLFPENMASKQEKNLQFPDKFQLAISYVNSNKSQLIKDEFFPNLKKSKYNCWNKMHEYLTMYRFFKETRNAYIHSGGLASQIMVDFYDKVMVINSNNNSIFKYSLACKRPEIDKKIVLNIHDCIRFADIVKQIIFTFDAALSVSSLSEKVLSDRLKKIISTNEKWKHLPGEKAKYTQRIHRILSASRIPEPQNIDNLILWMKDKNLIMG